MAGVPIDQLPADVRARLGLPKSVANKRPAGRSRTKGGAWICHTHGEHFVTWASVERHSDEHGCRRFDCDLTGDGAA